MTPALKVEAEVRPMTADEYSGLDIGRVVVCRNVGPIMARCKAT